MTRTLSMPLSIFQADNDKTTIGTAQLGSDSQATGQLTLDSEVLPYDHIPILTSVVFKQNGTGQNCARIVQLSPLPQFQLFSTISAETSTYNYKIMYDSTFDPGVTTISGAPNPAGLTVLDRTPGWTTYGRGNLANGTATVTTGYAQSLSRIFVSRQYVGSPNLAILNVANSIVGTSFTVTSTDPNDNGWFYYFIQVDPRDSYIPMGHSLNLAVLDSTPGPTQNFGRIQLTSNPMFIPRNGLSANSVILTSTEIPSQGTPGVSFATADPTNNQIMVGITGAGGGGASLYWWLIESAGGLL